MSPRERSSPFRWLTDTLSAAAFCCLAFYLTRAAKGLGGIPMVFVFLVTGGAGFAFARSAWRGVTGARDDAKKLPNR